MAAPRVHDHPAGYGPSPSPPPSTSSAAVPIASPVSPHPHLATLPLLSTSRGASNHRVSLLSSSKNRLSTLSTASSSFSRSSRPQSTAYPVFHSTLPYAFVRDFAYPATHYMHYGPPPEPVSSTSTPASEFHRRLSDPLNPPSASSRGHWTTAYGVDESSSESHHPFPQQLPATAYRDGPPWSEDDDLQSPIVTVPRGRARTTQFDGSRAAGAEHQSRGHGSSGLRSDGQAYGVTNGPGSEYAQDSAGRGRDYFGQETYASDAQADYGSEGADNHMYEDEEGYDETRYSRNYQFSIASPDEEMHGKAVALYDFARENENELPLREGQVIMVSYRNGEGWLVAEDPRSGETGLVPEGFVRLLREIEGGLASLNGGEIDDEDRSPLEGDTPTAAAGIAPELLRANSGRSRGLGFDPSAENATPTSTTVTATASAFGTSSPTSDAQHYPSVQSTFTTSSKDLEPYPSHLLNASPPSADTSSFDGNGHLDDDAEPEVEEGVRLVPRAIGNPSAKTEEPPSEVKASPTLSSQVASSTAIRKDAEREKSRVMRKGSSKRAGKR